MHLQGEAGKASHQARGWTKAGLENVELVGKEGRGPPGTGSAGVPFAQRHICGLLSHICVATSLTPKRDHWWACHEHMPRPWK